jgi:hypothetical protein
MARREEIAAFLGGDSPGFRTGFPDPSIPPGHQRI